MAPDPQGPDVSPLTAHLGYWMRLVANHVSQGFQRKVEACGVTVSEWVLLREVLRLGPTDAGALVASMGMTKGAVSKLVDRLEAKDLLSRAPGRHDRRMQSLALTRRGRQLVPRLAHLADCNDAKYFGHLSEAERARLAQTLRGIARRHAFKAVPVS